MNTRQHKLLKKEDVRVRLEELSRSLLTCFDEGLVNVDIAFHRSSVDVTMPHHSDRAYEPGPTVKVHITLHNPKDKRAEEWR